MASISLMAESQDSQKKLLIKKDEHFNASLSENEVENPTLQPAFPRAKATALPIPLEAPVITITGASTFCGASVVASSTVATCALMPAYSSSITQEHQHKHNNTVIKIMQKSKTFTNMAN